MESGIDSTADPGGQKKSRRLSSRLIGCFWLILQSLDARFVAYNSGAFLAGQLGLLVGRRACRQYRCNNARHRKQRHFQPEILRLFPERNEQIPATHQLDRIPGNDCRRNSVADSRRYFPELHQTLEQIHGPDGIQEEEHIGGH